MTWWTRTTGEVVVTSLLVLCGAVGSGCGGDSGSSFGEGGGASSSGASGASGSSSSGGFDTSNAATNDCSEAAKLVYVLSQENDLYSFRPNTLTFTKIGRLDCPEEGPPASMAVDRSGTAWVNYAKSGKVFKVSTTDARCSTTSFAPNQHGFLKFGSAFATNAKGAADETLYVSGLVGLEGKGFGKLDVATLTITMLGEYSGALAGKAAELTGTGDARLYGFFTTSPNATLAEIDRQTGATTNERPLPGVDTGNAFAFSFWGGDFWFYTSDGPTPSKVTHLRTSSDGELALAMNDVGGFRIVGAGVSTCAPLAPPK